MTDTFEQQLDGGAAAAPAFSGDVDPGARALVAALLAELLDAGTLAQAVVSVLAGGAINRSFLVEGPGFKHVLRVAPSAEDTADIGIDMTNSAVVARITGAAGVGPAVIGVKMPEGHSLIEFVPGVLNNETLREGARLHDVGTAVRELHSLPAPEVRAVSTFSEIDDWLARAARQEGVSIAEFDELRPQLEAVAAVIEAVDGRCLSHRDLNPQNCIHTGTAAKLIDWDFSGVDSPYLDLAMLTTYADLTEAEARIFWAAAIGEVQAEDVARIQLMRFAHAIREWSWARMARATLLGKAVTDDGLLPAGAEEAEDFYTAFGDVNRGHARRFAADPRFAEWLEAAASSLPAPGFR
ncbi:MAG: phosphotransferase [Baekduia sp.]